MSALVMPSDSQADPAAAFAALHAALAVPVRSYLGRLLSDGGAAEDAAQETWLKVHRALPEYLARPAFNGRAFVYRVAHNQAMDYLRRGQSVAAGGRVRFVPLDAPPPFVLERAGGSAAGPETLLLRGAADATVRGLAGVCMEALPHGERDLLWLQTVAGWSADSIARRYDATRPAIKSRVFRARERLDAAVATELRAVAAGRGIAFRIRDGTDSSAGPAACWRWYGAVNRRGALVRVGGKRGNTASVRRLLCALAYGPLSPWAYALNLCGDSGCVNPAHTTPGRKRGGGVSGSSGSYVPFTAEEIHRLPSDPAELRRRCRAIGLSYRRLAFAAGYAESDGGWRVMSADSRRYRVGLEVLWRYEDALARLERERREQAA